MNLIFFAGEFSALKTLLEEFGKNFDPTDKNLIPSPLNRHANAHGVPHNATFLDGLSAIFLFDVALVLFSKVRKGLNEYEVCLEL